MEWALDILCIRHHKCGKPTTIHHLIPCDYSSSRWIPLRSLLAVIDKHNASKLDIMHEHNNDHAIQHFHSNMNLQVHSFHEEPSLFQTMLHRLRLNPCIREEFVQLHP